VKWVTEEEIADGGSLYGLFVPMQMAMPDEVDFLDHPHRILIYKNPLEESFPIQSSSASKSAKP